MSSASGSTAPKMTTATGGRAGEQADEGTEDKRAPAGGAAGRAVTQPGAAAGGGGGGGGEMRKSIALRRQRRAKEKNIERVTQRCLGE